MPAARLTPPAPHNVPARTASVRAVHTAERGSRRSPDLGVRMNTPRFRNSPCTHATATVHDMDSGDDISRLEGEGGIVAEPDGGKVDPKAAVAEVIEATRH